MAPERITVTIQSSLGEEAPLTVQDAMRQILDLFELLESAGGEDGRLVAWRLVSVSMNSPLTATAEAVAAVPGIVVGPIAKREKAALAHSLNEIVEDRPLPRWMDDPLARERAKRLLRRNTNGIGRTDIVFGDIEPPAIIVSRSAARGLASIERQEANTKIAADQSRTEYTTLEGTLLGATSYHGKPALRLAERLSGNETTCVFSSELAERIGTQHDWFEVWSNARVNVTGRAHYNRDGKLRLFSAQEIESTGTRDLRYSEIADPNFTGGKRVSSYLDSLWEGDVGG